ncbi:MBL fold metallo-hydrolase [Planotetraspora kaengkrachanensis]|uniref:MBL fold metallo-hydrolase n=1 Tax=Planotetraspora kaengkrachanensis TaxID=575193 RepID=A0A8J3PS72_9ACTN|nr:MBL fold metallo-hydrolase [Planotetraspora kaengkrachanensis]GIG77936.1 MBL fold metallo-hydrolase [Planotetraspora kaengkrachanensis]
MTTVTSTHDGAGSAPEAAALHEIVEGVFAWVQPDGTWWINNAGAVSGPDGTIVVDTCATEVRTRRFLAAVGAATGDAPLTMAVNTHLHGDHTYGNSLLPSSTVLIGHEAMREGLLTDPIIDGCPPVWQPVPDWGGVTRRVPSVVLRSDLTLFTGSRRVDLLHPGYSAHTTGDVVAWLPEERVLFTGDLIFHGVTPLVFMGSVEGAIASLGWLADFGADHVVPGHGPLIDGAALPGVLADVERYLQLVLRTARTGLDEGLTPLEAAQRCDLGEFAAWPDAERLVLNLHRAYADAAGRPFDLLEAIGDAVRYNGGPMASSV